MEEKKNAPEKNSDSNLMAALSYLWVASVLIYVAKKSDEYVSFHAKQGIVLFVISFVLFFVGWIPVLGWALWILWLVATIIGFIKAYSGEKFKLPLIGDLANKF